MRFVLLIAILFISVRAEAADRALLVGIGNYDRQQTGWGLVHGDKDIELLSPLLKSRGFIVETLINSKATKRNIIVKLTELASKCHSGDRVYFHFSGHGQPVRDDNHDETGGKKYDESIVPFDACRDNTKLNGTYYGQNHLIDDELFYLFDAIKKKLGPGGELFVAVDACNSRGIEKDEFVDEDFKEILYIRGSDNVFVPKSGNSYLANIRKPGKYSVGAPMTVVTACASDQRNIEFKVGKNQYYGPLSYYIYLLIKKGNVDFASWKKKFESKEYKKSGIFPDNQTPGVISY